MMPASSPRRRRAPAWSAATWCAKCCPISRRLAGTAERMDASVDEERANERAEPGHRQQPAARRRARLRHEVEHSAASVRHGLPRDDSARHGDGGGSARAGARRRVPLERPRRSRAAATTRSARSAACSARSRSSASASATSCSAWPAARRRSSSSSAIAARIIRCRICRRARSKSRRRTTASRSPKIRCPNFLEVTHRNLNDNTIEGSRHRDVPVLQRAVPPRSLGRPARQPLSLPQVPSTRWQAHSVTVGLPNYHN